MAGKPPLGAVQATAADALPGVAVTLVGAFGALRGPLAGVTELEAVDDGEVPAELVAVTVNVYGVPLVNPVTVEFRPVVLRPPHPAHVGLGMMV